MKGSAFNWFVAGMCAFAAVVSAINGSAYFVLLDGVLCAGNVWCAVDTDRSRA